MHRRLRIESLENRTLLSLSSFVDALPDLQPAGEEVSSEALPLRAAGTTVANVVSRVSQSNYTHIHQDLLYTHTGDNRGRSGAQHDLARNNVLQYFQNLGLTAALEPFTFNSETYYNVVATKTGATRPNDVYIVGAHYDSVDNPGADDNASGTAAVMEIARALANYSFDATMRFIAFDLEEDQGGGQSLLGSTAYVAAHSGDAIRGMVSLDMIAYNMAGAGHDKVWLCDWNNQGTIRTDLAAAFVAYSGGLATQNYSPDGSSDHYPFEAAGFDAALVIEYAGTENPYYHGPNDAVETANYIDYAFAMNVVRASTGYLATAAGLRDTSNGVGLFAGDTAFLLKIANECGSADKAFQYGVAGWLPVAGDWDGDAVAGVGLYDPTSSVFYLKNAHSGGFADQSFAYGPAGGGWLPIAGDWNGDGTQTVGLYDPATSVFYLRNSHAGGPADAAFQYGPGGAGWLPIAGDWDGNRTTTIGLYDPASGVFYLKNTNAGGNADLAFGYGPGTWRPLAGDWDGDGAHTVGLYETSGSVFYLRNSNTSGLADTAFGYGPPACGWQPLAGNWRSVSPQAAAGPGENADAAPLSQAELRPILVQAVADWASLGLAAERIGQLAGIRFDVADLPGSLLGLAEPGAITIDLDAAGHGWFIDPTPRASEEFARGEFGSLHAVDPDAVDRIDLLTVVSHELGHALGLGDLDASADGLMSGLLGPGVRREVGAAEIDALFASA